MKRTFTFFCFILLFSILNSQESIDFEFSFPENSNFIVEQKIDNSGIMIISGSPKELEEIKKAGYNLNRKLKYLMNYTSVYKTEKKSDDSFPFQLYYSNIVYNIDSDGKKQKKENGIPNAILKGNLVDGKLKVTEHANSGSTEQDQFVNSLPKYFQLDFPTKKNMKIGDTFSVLRNADNKTDGYSFSANMIYTLSKIENDFAYFKITITSNSPEKSTFSSSGIGNGDMKYNFKDKYILSETYNLTLKNTQTETVKIIVENIIINSYELKLQ